MNNINILSYIQSTLRNVGVFTTISIAFLREAFIYSTKNKNYNIIYLIFSFIFLVISLVIDTLLLKFINKNISKHQKKGEDKDYLEPYKLMCILLLFILISFLLFGVYRFITKIVRLL